MNAHRLIIKYLFHLAQIDHCKVIPRYGLKEDMSIVIGTVQIFNPNRLRIPRVCATCVPILHRKDYERYSRVKELRVLNYLYCQLNFVKAISQYLFKSLMMVKRNKCTTYLKLTNKNLQYPSKSTSI